MRIAVVIPLVCLPWTLVHGQDSPPKDEKKSARVIRVLIAGQRAMPTFENHGGQYVEVEPATKWIAPNALEWLDAPQSTDKKKDAKIMAWPNEVVSLGRCHCPPTLRLRLIRTLAQSSPPPPEITCDLGDLKDPLVIISAEDGAQGWDKPQARVIDLAGGKVPARTVVALNLTRIPLVTRFESQQGKLAPGALLLLHLPTSESEVFRFRIDAQSKSGMIPLANSSYQIGATERLILITIPNSQVALGGPPLTLQMILDKP